MLYIYYICYIDTTDVFYLLYNCIRGVATLVQLVLDNLTVFMSLVKMYNETFGRDVYIYIQPS